MQAYEVRGYGSGFRHFAEFVSLSGDRFDGTRFEITSFCRQRPLETIEIPVETVPDLRADGPDLSEPIGEFKTRKFYRRGVRLVDDIERVIVHSFVEER